MYQLIRGAYGRLCSKEKVPLFSLKPIFHCDTKPFALGTGVGLDPQCHNLAYLYKHVGI